ncbi:MAG: hypothetical protein IPO36_03720 [Anaerolineales bacterium]|jgi:hypothetical protein|uniref:hypothetical protein n=1 Tax=Candidatus Villigracilis affinis TaxID=3140682 RepID=UPI001D90231A|nr:hypothetical protein [Anaerolineales bacterium]MBK9600940.1 hypothetical protein [Anaerolineales bacterium]MBL0345319.1 hypothetical protein [Anaerolineales bacterium]
MNIYEKFKMNGYFSNYAAIITVIGGIYLHLTSLFIGRELLKEHILTPAFDMVFAIPMAYAGIIGWLSWNKVVFDKGWKKFFYGFIMTYFTVSIPLHVQTYLTQSTGYIDAFPAWYSYPILVLMVLILVFMWNIRYKNMALPGEA